MNNLRTSGWRIVETLSVWLNHVAALGLALMMIHISVDVICRYFFNSPLPGTIEIVSAYYMVAVVAFPLAYVHFREEHIRVELFTGGMSNATREKLDLFIEVILFVSFLVLAIFNFEEAWLRTEAGDVWEAGTRLIDIWPGRWFLPIAFAVVALVSLLRILIAFVPKKMEKTNDL